MSIQYGSLPIMDIKYCDPQGTLKNVSSVARNGVNTWVKPATENYLTLTAQEANSSVSFTYMSGKNVYYRVNEGEWIACPSVPYPEPVILSSVGDKIQYKGIGVVTDWDWKFSMTGLIAGSGSVTSLTDGVGIDRNVSLTRYCYYAIFGDCTSLTTAPEFPATTLAQGCYCNAFSGCTSLTTAPTLPASTVVTECYYAMFNRCRSLTLAPDLLATTLAYHCYLSMFKNCTSLSSVKTHQSDFGNNCLEWLSVNDGEFHCKPSLAAQITERTTSTVPSGWTIITDVPES